MDKLSDRSGGCTDLERCILLAIWSKLLHKLNKLWLCITRSYVNCYYVLLVQISHLTSYITCQLAIHHINTYPNGNTGYLKDRSQKIARL